MGGTGRPTVLGSLARSRGLGGRGARGRQSCPRGARFRGGAACRPPSAARVHREPRSAGPGHWIMTSKSNTSARPFPRSALLPGKTGAWVTSESHIALLFLAAPPPGECQWQRVPGMLGRSCARKPRTACPHWSPRAPRRSARCIWRRPRVEPPPAASSVGPSLPRWCRAFNFKKQ